MRSIVWVYCVEDSVTGKPEDRTGRKGFPKSGLYQFYVCQGMFGVPSDAKKGRWRSREQDVRRQPLCGEARQDGGEHGEYSAGLLHIEQLKEAILQEVAAIPPAMTRKAMDNFRERLQDFLINNGWHLSDVIFKSV